MIIRSMFERDWRNNKGQDYKQVMYYLRKTYNEYCKLNYCKNINQLKIKEFDFSTYNCLFELSMLYL